MALKAFGIILLIFMIIGGIILDITMYMDGPIFTIVMALGGFISCMVLSWMENIYDMLKAITTKLCPPPINNNKNR